MEGRLKTNGCLCCSARIDQQKRGEGELSYAKRHLVRDKVLVGVTGIPFAEAEEPRGGDLSAKKVWGTG